MNISNTDTYGNIISTVNDEPSKEQEPSFSFSKVIKNFSFLSLGQISGDLFTFIFFVVISRIFGEYGIGQYSFAMGLTGFYAIISDFGLYHFTVKELSSEKVNSLFKFSKIFSVRIILSLIIFCVMLLTLPFLKFSYETKLIIIIIGLYQILYKIVDGISAVFVANEKMYYSGIIESSMKISIALAGILTAYITKNLLMVLTIMPVIAGIQIIISSYLVNNKIGKISLQLKGFKIKEILFKARAFGFSEFLNQIYTRIDIVLIGFLLGETATGLYNVAFRIIFFLQFIPVFASISLFPVAAKLFKKSKSELQIFYNDSLKIIIFIGIPVTIGIFLTSEQVINLLFGKEFGESVLILKILSSIFLLKCLSSVMSIYLFACNKQNEKLRDQFAATILSIIGNIILIKIYGITGAAIAITFAETLLVILYSIRLKKELGKLYIITKVITSLAATAGFAVPLYIWSFSLYTAIPFSILIYLIISLLFKDVRENELSFLISYLSKKNY